MEVDPAPSAVRESNFLFLVPLFLLQLLYENSYNKIIA